MKRFLPLLTILWLSTILVGCAPIRLRQAREELDAAVAQLPEPQGFEIVTVIAGEYDRTWYQQRCFYGQALIAIGTDLPSDEALEAYRQALEDQNWVVRRETEDVISLLRGEHEKITVYRGGSAGIIASDERYKDAKDRYDTFLFLVQDYLLPDRVTCVGE
mgnify:CR=1 FL=1